MTKHKNRLCLSRKPCAYGKIVQDTKYVFHYSTRLLFKHFFAPVNTERVTLEMGVERHVGLPTNRPELLSGFNHTCNSSIDFTTTKQYQLTVFCECCDVQSRGS
jgi:hypothetical protein